jgi:hypothetical protein
VLLPMAVRFTRRAVTWALRGVSVLVALTRTADARNQAAAAIKRALAGSS